MMKKRIRDKNIPITPELHQHFKIHCVTKGINIKEMTEWLIRKELKEK
jgi:hypothetical protein